MLKRMVNGVEVELSAQEETDTRAEWAASDAQAVIDDLASEKAAHKDMLMRQKVESMLIPELAQVDAAKTRSAIRAIRIK